MNDDKYREYRETILNLSQLPLNWNGRKWKRPNIVAEGLALIILECIIDMDLPLIRIVPSADGGMAFIFTQEGLVADIECFNSGSVVGMNYDHNIIKQLYTRPEIIEFAKSIESFFHK